MMKFLYYFTLILILLERLNEAEFKPLKNGDQISLGLLVVAVLLFSVPFFKKLKMNSLVNRWEGKTTFIYKGRMKQVNRVKGVVSIIFPLFALMVIMVIMPGSQELPLKLVLLLLALFATYNLNNKNYFLTGPDFMILFANYWEIIDYKKIKELSLKESHLMINTRHNAYYVLDLKDYSKEELQKLFVLLNKVADQHQIKLNQALLNA